MVRTRAMKLTKKKPVKPMKPGMDIFLTELLNKSRDMIQNRRQVIDMKQHSRRPRKKGTSQKFTEKLLKIKMNLSKASNRVLPERPFKEKTIFEKIGDEIQARLKRSAPPAELEKIIAASEMNGTLHFELKFKNIDQSEFMEATVANLRYPQEVIAFYQDRIRWD